MLSKVPWLKAKRRLARRETDDDPELHLDFPTDAGAGVCDLHSVTASLRAREGRDPSA